MTRLLYNDNNIIGRLFKYFSVYFENLYVSTAETVFLLVLSMLAVESASSVRSLYNHFLVGIIAKSLNAFYYAFTYSKLDTRQFMNITGRMALKLIPSDLREQPVFICIDDTMVPKAGKTFDNVAVLFDHASHNGSNYLNGHCFVSLMLCIPIWNGDKIKYLSILLGYRMWEKDKVTKIKLAASMVHQVMPEFSDLSQVIILCDSWYVNSILASVVGEYANLGLIGGAKSNAVMYELPSAPTGKRGRPKKYGERIYIGDINLSDEKIGNYYIGYQKVLTNIFAST